MSYNGSGTFVINTSGQPVVTGTVISSTAFNALTADLGTGLSTAITKDGQTATTARIPFVAGLSSALVTDTTSGSTGSIFTAGGIGIAKAVYVGTTATVAGTTDSSSTTTGAIITAGGAGVAKALFVGTTANVAGAVTLQSTLAVGGVATYSAQPIFSSLTASSAVATDASKGLVSVTNTGTGNNVLATSPTLVTPVLGTPQSATLTNATGLPLSTGVTGVLLEANGGTGTTVGYNGFKNRIINGAMVIDQRNAGASVTPTTDGTYTLDRWRVGITVSSKFSVQQTATAPTGFVNSLKATSLSAYSVGAGDAFLVTQAVEGYNVSDLGWGTASAKTVTLSFQVYSSLTGTFGGSVYNSAGNRSYPFSYSVPVANTWTSISITIAGDTSGTWLTTNGIGLQISFGLGAGTTFSGTAGAWAGSLYFSATGAVSVVGTNGATFYITGVQLEKGSTATSFEYRPYGTELALCQRYYQQLGGVNGQSIGVGIATSSSTAVSQVTFVVPMRSAPTPTFANLGFTDSVAYTSAVSSLGSNLAGTTSTSLTTNGAASMTTQRAGSLIATSTSGFLFLSSEL